MSSSLSTTNYLERSSALKQIEQDYAKAEKSPVDLERTAAKLQYLVKAMNDDIAAINQGAKVSPEVRQAYLNHREELQAVTERVNQTGQKTNDNNVSRWVNAAAAVSTAYLAYSYWPFETGAPTGTNPGKSSPAGSGASTGTNPGKSSPAGSGAPTGTNPGKSSPAGSGAPTGTNPGKSSPAGSGAPTGTRAPVSTPKSTPTTIAPTGTSAPVNTLKSTPTTSAPTGMIESLAVLVRPLHDFASRSITQITISCSRSDGLCSQGVQLVQSTIGSISSLLTFRNVALLTIGSGALAATITIIWPTAVFSGTVTTLGMMYYQVHRVRRYFTTHAITPAQQNADRILNVVCKNLFAIDARINIFNVKRHLFAQIATLKRISQNLLDATFDCNICMQPLLPQIVQPLLDVGILPGCGHLSHGSCLNQWISTQIAALQHPNCVECRNPIPLTGFHHF